MTLLIRGGIFSKRLEALKGWPAWLWWAPLRRNLVATILPNEASLLRLASSGPSEISIDWETERACLAMEVR